MPGLPVDGSNLPAAAVTPIGIELDRPGRRLRFQWADGAGSDFDWEYLRWRCPCAHCAGEGEWKGTLATTLILTLDQTQMVDVDLVGRYAVKPTWQDGHDTGLYTFRNLRALAEQDGLVTPPADATPAPER